MRSMYLLPTRALKMFYSDYYPPAPGHSLPFHFVTCVPAGPSWQAEGEEKGRMAFRLGPIV
jgi:hypothetical protein